jgi:hypothetical protein
MVIETKGDELIDERYKDTIMQSSHSLTHWDTIEVSREDYERYERLRIELYELTQELKEKN